MENIRIRKRFMATMVVTILLIINDSLALGLDSTTVYAIGGIVMTYITGQSYTDGEEARAVKNSVE